MMMVQFVFLPLACGFPRNLLERDVKNCQCCKKVDNNNF